MQPTRRQVVMACAALMGPAMLRFPALAAAAQELVITTYGGVWEAFWRKTLVPAFETATGAKATLDVGYGRIFSANLRAAGKDKPPYSMVMMNEVFASRLRKEGYLREARPLAAAQLQRPVPDRQDRRRLGRDRHDLADRHRLPHRPGARPRRNPGRICGPTRSSRARSASTISPTAPARWMVLLTGEDVRQGPYDVDAGLDALAELGPVHPGRLQPVDPMSTGEIVVAPFDFGEIARLKHQGLPVDCIVPEEGMLMFDQTFSILRQRPGEGAGLPVCRLHPVAGDPD